MKKLFIVLSLFLALQTEAFQFKKESMLQFCAAQISGQVALRLSRPIVVFCHELGHFVADKLCYGKTDHIHIGVSYKLGLDADIYKEQPLYENNWLTLHNKPFTGSGYCERPGNHEERTAQKEFIVFASGAFSAFIASLAAAKLTRKLITLDGLSSISQGIGFGIYGAFLAHMTTELTNWYPHYSKFGQTNDGALMQKMLSEPAQKYYKPAAVSAITLLAALGTYITFSTQGKEQIILRLASLKNKFI